MTDIPEATDTAERVRKAQSQKVHATLDIIAGQLRTTQIGRVEAMAYNLTPASLLAIEETLRAKGYNVSMAPIVGGGWLIDVHVREIPAGDEPMVDLSTAIKVRSITTKALADNDRTRSAFEDGRRAADHRDMTDDAIAFAAGVLYATQHPISTRS